MNFASMMMTPATTAAASASSSASIGAALLAKAASVQSAATQSASTQSASTEAGSSQTPAAQTAAAQAAPNPHEAQVRAKIKESSKAFEASFLSMMYQNMFQDVDLGGGAGGEAFKSFLLDAVGKQMAKTGGIGLAPSVQREMLKLQGLH
jgi:flagellar protein FlgJ